jgi:glyoxylase-like metal-dependent hydrolase (beta-lactamase superfamily II)
MRVIRLQVGPLETNCWVVGDTANGPVLVIDPGGDAALIEGSLGPAGLAAVILTHAHFDHVGGAAELLERTPAPLMVHRLDAERITHDSAHGTGGSIFGHHGVVAPEPDRILDDGDVIEAGRLRFTVFHTPGHTEGGICLFCEDPDGGAPHLFSGDTLFAGSVGRSDFPGGDGRALKDSIASKLAGLPPETVVHPGHGPDTTIAREARVNPFWPRA